MIRELDTVVLQRDIDEHGLKQGDVGAVVHRYHDGSAFEVEFVTAGGDTVGVLTLTPSDIRPMKSTEILHVRVCSNPVTVTNRTYRRRRGGDTWHWCRNCSTWPDADFEETTVKPRVGELCNECKAKEKMGACSM
jgi:hypothetical protein